MRIRYIVTLEFRYYCAPEPGTKEPIRVVKTTTLGMFNTLEAAAKCGNKCIDKLQKERIFYNHKDNKFEYGPLASCYQAITNHAEEGSVLKFIIRIKSEAYSASAFIKQTLEDAKRSYDELLKFIPDFIPY